MRPLFLHFFAKYGIIEPHNKKKKQEDDMIKETNKINNKTFNQFLKTNKKKINSVVPKNPSIPKSDEWRDETFWDENNK